MCYIYTMHHLRIAEAHIHLHTHGFMHMLHTQTRAAHKHTVTLNTYSQAKLTYIRIFTDSGELACISFIIVTYCTPMPKPIIVYKPNSNIALIPGHYVLCDQ